MKKIEFLKIEDNTYKANGTHSIIDIVISKEDDIYCSLSLDFNIASEGETEEEALKNLLEAIQDYIELAIENRLELYRHVPIEDNPLVVDKKSIVSILKIAVNLDLEYLEDQLYV